MGVYIAKNVKECLPEEKLSVQVTDVDRVHVDDMNVFEPGEGEIRENLAAQPSGPDDKNLAAISQKIFDLGRVSRTWRLKETCEPHCRPEMKDQCGGLVCQVSGRRDSSDPASLQSNRFRLAKLRQP